MPGRAIRIGRREERAFRKAVGTGRGRPQISVANDGSGLS